LCYQIRTLDKRRLGRAFGTLDDETLRREIINALTFQLDVT
jgi:mRNA-degrading endonuclease toxin of MazEF toxin-antitoxin module